MRLEDEYHEVMIRTRCEEPQPKENIQRTYQNVWLGIKPEDEYLSMAKEINEQFDLIVRKV